MTTNEKNEILKGAKTFLKQAELGQLNMLLDNIINPEKQDKTNVELLVLFETAKSVEGCSKASLKYYLYILNSFFKICTKNANDITTEDIRNYLDTFSSKYISKV